MKIEELLTTYWSQFTLLLLAFSYFIKRILDLISKKREINHNLFQEYRLKAVYDFYTSYSKAERMWQDLSIYPIIEYKIGTKEMDKIIFGPIDELRKNVLELQIYFSTKEHNVFEKLLNNILSINGKLSSIYFDYDKVRTPITKSNEFGFFRDAKLKENNELLKEVSKIIKKTFN